MLPIAKDKYLDRRAKDIKTEDRKGPERRKILSRVGFVRDL
jgi:hypothetical protein